MATYAELQKMIPRGYSVDRYSPGDGGYRYRFFNKPNGDYWESDGIHTAFGMKAAVAYARGLGAPLRALRNRQSPAKSRNARDLAAAIGPARGTRVLDNLVSRIKAKSGKPTYLGSANYRLVAINEKTGKKAILTSSPVTLSEAHTMRLKFTPHRLRRIQVEPVEGKRKPTYLGKASRTAGQYTLARLRSLPTLESGHMDDLKVRTSTEKIWLSRMAKEDGMPYDNQVTIERLQNGRWVETRKYQAR